MKTVVMTGIAFIASAGAAFAADAGPVVAPGPFNAPPAYPAVVNPGPYNLPPVSPAVVNPGPFDAPPAFPQSRVYDWTGFYLGINGGGSFSDIKWFSQPDGIGGTQTVDSGLVGGTAGYNLQANEPVVVGFEADFDWWGLKGTITPPACLPGGCALDASWLGTARLRIGYAFDRIMPYATGGVALADLRADNIGTPMGSEVGRNLGWTAGAGVEFVISGALRAKIEYLHVDLNGFSCSLACSVPLGAGPVSFNVYSNVFRLGLNYRFWMQ
jgi:outer membrane immunogenic protein